MAFQVLPDGIKVEIKCRKNGALVVNVVWLTCSVTIDLAQLGNIAAAVHAWWNTSVKPFVTSSLALEEVVVTDWTAEDSLQVVEIVSPPLAGTRAGDDMPSNVAAVTTFYTGRTGRSYRGRAYNGGISASDITGNTLGTTYLVGMISAWQAFGAAVEGEACTHVVASFVADGVPRAEGIATPIVDYGMNNVVDTQRRRIPKVDA